MRDYANRATDDLLDLDKGQEAWDTVVERGKEFYEKGEEVVRDAGRSANLPNTYKIWPVRPSVERRKGENNMKIMHTCACMVMIGGILLGTGGIGQAQLGGGTSPGGTGSGSGVPPKSGGGMGTMDQGRESSGINGARKPQHVKTPARREFNNGRIR